MALQRFILSGSMAHVCTLGATLKVSSLPSASSVLSCLCLVPLFICSITAFPPKMCTGGKTNVSTFLSNSGTAIMPLNTLTVGKCNVSRFLAKSGSFGCFVNGLTCGNCSARTFLPNCGTACKALNTLTSGKFKVSVAIAPLKYLLQA